MITPEGETVREVTLPDADQIYDQQFRRGDTGDCLEVVYYDGTIRRYSAKDGTEESVETGTPPDRTLNEEFETADYLVQSPLHGTPEVYERASGKRIGTLEEDAFLTYVTQTENPNGLITEYVSAQGARYGLLLDTRCRVIAKMNDLCDILSDGTLVFDDYHGNLHRCKLYSLDELLKLGQGYKEAQS